jgi:virginiamycin B lyase
MRAIWMVAMAAVALAGAVTGAARAEHPVRVFDVPKGAHPHDVAPGLPGTIWYTAQWQGALGIIDIKSGKVEQVKLGEKSSPHGVIMGPDGAAWITDGGLNAIVRVDPKTKAVKSFPLPADSGYTNLNTPAFDGKGRVWFTGQTGIYGRLDPKSGKLDVWPAPKGRGPYGIAATPDGQIWYVSLAGSFLAKVDMETGATTVVEPVEPGVGPRRVWSDSKGQLWVSEWNSGYLSRYTPKDGQWKRWKMPGDKPRAYAVYVDDRDVAWVTEWAGNVTIAFDTKAEKIIGTYPGSGPKAEVRQILGRKGEIYLPESGLDRVMLVETGKPG